MAPPPAWVAPVLHGLGTLEWQRLARLTGWPHRSPTDTPARSFLVLGLGAAGGVVASWSADLAAATISCLPPSGARRPACWAALGPLPVLGVGVVAAAEVSLARRYAGASSIASVPRAAAVMLVRATVHAVVSAVVLQALERAVQVPVRAAPPVADTRLDVRGPDLDAGEPADGYVVYLDGVGRCTERATPVARALAAALTDRLPRWSVVLSVMPNDVTQRPAWQRPLTGGLWHALHRRSSAWTVARGVWEAVVALDPRYRDRVSAEHTATVVGHLRAAGYEPGSGVPVVLVGLSGGAQTALRAASEAARALGGAPLDVVTFGAFADGSADLGGVRRVHAVVSWGDPAELLCTALFPSRWTTFGVGAWHRAKRAGTVVVRRHDYAHHIGPGGYLSSTSHAPDGRTRLAQAADVVSAAARQLTGPNSVSTTPSDADG